MHGVAAGGDHRRIVDGFLGQDVASQAVVLTAEQVSEGAELHLFLLQGSVGKQVGHGP